MTIRSIFTSLFRFVVEKSGSGMKIKYFRRQGMKIGENCRFETMSFSTEPYLIEVGNNVGISNGAVFITHDAGVGCFQHDLPNADVFGKIRIGNNVFVGINCTILPNTTIGDNCIVGAGSVVRGKFPADSVIVGNPAEVFMSMNVLKVLYQKNPGLLKTADLTDSEKKPIVKKHFGLD